VIKGKGIDKSKYLFVDQKILSSTTCIEEKRRRKTPFSNN